MAIRTADGVTLEARAAGSPASRGGVVVCHPHPLYGGDMDNPVVARAVEVCDGFGLATLRFNFRGVGASMGIHGDGIAERLDVEAGLDHCAGALAAGTRVALIGYSFGALVAAQVAEGRPDLAGLCLIAPPLTRRAASLPPALTAFKGSLHIIGGTQDDYWPPAAAEGLRGNFPNARVSLVEGANHFFLGKLFPLGEEMAAWARAVFPV